MKILLCLSAVYGLAAPKAAAQPQADSVVYHRYKGLFTPKAAAHPVAPTDTSQFSCRIRTSKTVYSQGEAIDFTVAIRNNTATPQTLIKAVPGSESYCFPTAKVEVDRLRAQGKKEPSKERIEQRRSCIVFSRKVDAANFVVVQPGQLLDPWVGTHISHWATKPPVDTTHDGTKYFFYIPNWTRKTASETTHYLTEYYSPLPSGEYEVCLTYSTVPTAYQQFELYNDAASEAGRKSLQALIAQVPAITLRSNTIRFTVTRKK